MAAALAGRRGLTAVHVIAHGAPARLSFAAGNWSTETLAREAEDFAAIGEALGPHGDLRLWSCRTGAGLSGASFIDTLAEVIGATVAAATGLVGASYLGGRWKLDARSDMVWARPPLTVEGMARYGGVMPTFTLTSSPGAATQYDIWFDTAAWGGILPPTIPAASTNFTFTSTASGGTIYEAIMPSTLNQATGTGTSTWTIAKAIGPAFTTSLTLINQGNLFVNGTNNFTAGSATTSWTITGGSTAAGANQYFENDGSVNVIGTTTTGVGSTTATFSGNANQSFNVVGEGAINVYGNASLVIGSNVGVSNGQTFNFITANGNTSGTITETSAPLVNAPIAGFLPGDTVILQNLIGSAVGHLE
jgi:hypothetical protein